MEGKIKIKTAQIELEYEGAEQFIKNELVKVVLSVTNLIKESELGDIPAEQPETLEVQEQESPKHKKIKLTTENIAAKLNVKSGRELAIAACAHLEFVKHKNKYLKSEILEEMKTASSYFKKAMPSNFSKYLVTLVKQDSLNSPETDTYTFSPKTKAELRKILVK